MVERRPSASATTCAKSAYALLISLLSASSQHSTARDALLSSLVSTHTVLGVKDGRFVSLLAPPELLTETRREL